MRLLRVIGNQASHRRPAFSFRHLPRHSTSSISTFQCLITFRLHANTSAVVGMVVRSRLSWEVRLSIDLRQRTRAAAMASRHLPPRLEQSTTLSSSILRALQRCTRPQLWSQMRTRLLEPILDIYHTTRHPRANHRRHMPCRRPKDHHTLLRISLNRLPAKTAWLNSRLLSPLRRVRAAVLVTTALELIDMPSDEHRHYYFDINILPTLLHMTTLTTLYALKRKLSLLRTKRPDFLITKKIPQPNRLLWSYT